MTLLSLWILLLPDPPLLLEDSAFVIFSGLSSFLLLRGTVNLTDVGEEGGELAGVTMAATVLFLGRDGDTKDGNDAVVRGDDEEFSFTSSLSLISATMVSVSTVQKLARERDKGILLPDQVIFFNGCCQKSTPDKF